MNTLLHFLENAIHFIFSVKAFDHILFLIFFSVIYQFREWKSLLALWCALGIGFSISLFLSGYGVIRFSENITQLILAGSLLLVAISGLLHREHSTPNALRYNLTVFLGLMQGIGLSLRYKSIAKPDFLSLLGFDLGLWVASFLVILLSLSISSLMVLSFLGNRRDFNLVYSGVGLGIALVLLWIRY